MDGEILHRYSGPRSVKFWQKVNACRGEKKYKMYALGCKLQELEAKVLKELRTKDPEMAKWLKEEKCKR